MNRINRVERALLIGQPMLFGAAVVLARFVTNATIPESLVRPVIVVVAVSGVILLVARVLLRDWVLAAVASSAFVLLSLREPLPGAVLAAVTAWWLLIIVARRASGRTLPPRKSLIAAGRASGIFSLALVAAMGFSAWSAASSGAIASAGAGAYTTDGEGGPNVYLLVLDGYPRSDTLAETFGIDNGPFTESLKSLGFSVAPAARSNYTNTWLTFASTFNGRYVNDMLGDRPIPADEPTQIRWLQSLISEAEALDVLRDRGYVIRTVASSVGSTTLTSADDHLNDGRLTGFEIALIVTSPWSILLSDPIGETLLSSHRGGVTDGLEQLASVAEARPSEPQFVLAHIESPHPPFVLRPADGAPTAPECFPTACSLWATPMQQLGLSFDDYRNRLAEQIASLNQLVEETLVQVVTADPTAVVVVFSDHGIRYSLEDSGEHTKILFAARTPGVPRVFPSDVHLVNLLRNVFSKYFRVDAAPLPYHGWLADWIHPLDLTPITDVRDANLEGVEGDSPPGQEPFGSPAEP